MIFIPPLRRSRRKLSTWCRSCVGNRQYNSTPHLSRRNHPGRESCRTPCTWSTACGSTCPAPSAPPPNTSCCTLDTTFFLRTIKKYKLILHISDYEMCQDNSAFRERVRRLITNSLVFNEIRFKLGLSCFRYCFLCR